MEVTRRFRPFMDRLLQKPIAVMMLAYHSDQNGVELLQRDFAGFHKMETAKEYMGMLADWANNDLTEFKGRKNELWYVHVIVPDTSTMKPSMGNIALYHNGSAEAKKWAAETKDAIRNGDPAELFIEKRATGKAAAPKLAKPKVGVPKRAARPIAAAPAETPVGKPVPRRRRKPIADKAA